jgi:hypothetical protein
MAHRTNTYEINGQRVSIAQGTDRWDWLCTIDGEPSRGGTSRRDAFENARIEITGAERIHRTDELGAHLGIGYRRHQRQLNNTLKRLVGHSDHLFRRHMIRDR